MQTTLKTNLLNSNTLQEILNVLQDYIKENYNETINTNFSNLLFDSYVMDKTYIENIMTSFSYENLLSNLLYYITQIKKIKIQTTIKNKQQVLPHNKNKLIEYLKLEYPNKSETELTEYQDKLINGEEKFEFEEMNILNYLKIQLPNYPLNFELFGEFEQFIGFDVNEQIDKNIISVDYNLKSDVFKWLNIQLEIVSDIMNFNPLSTIDYQDIITYVNINTEEKIIKEIDIRMKNLIDLFNKNFKSIDDFMKNFKYLNKKEVQFQKNQIDINKPEILDTKLIDVYNKLYYLFN